VSPVVLAAAVKAHTATTAHTANLGSFLHMLVSAQYGPWIVIVAAVIGVCALIPPSPERR
jgi:hypothetical protein